MREIKKTEATITPGKQNLFWLLLICFLLLGSLRLLIYWAPDLLKRTTEADLAEQREALQFSLYEVLFEFGIRVDWISGDNTHKKVRIPQDLSLHEPYSALVSRFIEQGGMLLRAESNPNGNRKRIEVGLAGESLFRITLQKDNSISRISGKIAIVIDDFGNAFKTSTRNFLALEQPISVSVLPGLEFSQKVSEAASERGLEVLLHLPMEPANEKFRADDYMLLTEMSETEIRQRVRSALKAVPTASGVNNHMGSLATIHQPLLQPMMQELKKAEVFFLDSMTHPESQAHIVARQTKIPTVINNTFLDSIKEEPFIRKQVHLLGEMASRNGHAVGIGHPREMTLKVLKEEMPKLAKLGYKFVAVSELTK